MALTQKQINQMIQQKGYKMSAITHKDKTITYDDMDDILYNFTFSSKNYTGDKIIIQKSQLQVFKFCLDNCINFHDGTRTIIFDHQGNHTNMTIKIPGKSDLHYKLFDDEKPVWWQYVIANNLI